MYQQKHPTIPHVIHNPCSYNTSRLNGDRVYVSSSRQELNLDIGLRRPAFYPLNYERELSNKALTLLFDKQRGALAYTVYIELEKKRNPWIADT